MQWRQQYPPAVAQGITGTVMWRKGRLPWRQRARWLTVPESLGSSPDQSLTSCVSLHQMGHLSMPQDSHPKWDCNNTNPRGSLRELNELVQAKDLEQCLAHVTFGGKKKMIVITLGSKFNIPSPISKSNNFASGASITTWKLKAQLWRENAPLQLHGNANSFAWSCACRAPPSC